MDVILDTHVIVWMMAAPDMLSESTREFLEDGRHHLWASSASAYEVTQKVRLGKWKQAEPLAVAWQERIADYGVQDLALAGSDMVLAGSLNWAHRDPFDRMLCAQGLRRGWALVSADAVFGEIPGLRWMKA